MAFSFEQWIGQNGILGQNGFYNILLPIILLIVILYGILEMIKIFGDDSKGHKINVIISLILALFVTYSTGYLAWFASVVSTMSGLIGIILIGLLFLFILYGMIKGESLRDLFGTKNWIKWVIFGICIIIVFLLFNRSGGLNLFAPNLNVFHIPISTPAIVLVLIVAGLVALVVWALKEPGSTTSAQHH